MSGAAAPVAQAARPAWITSVLARCGGLPTIEPSTFVLSCAGANGRLIDLHWRTWRPHAAFGQGIQSTHSRHHQVLVVLWGIKRLRDHDWYFTHLTLIYQGRPPAHMPRTVTIALTGRGPA